MAGLLLKGWRQLRDALSPRKFQRRLKDEVGKATKANALLAETAIKTAIYEGGHFEKNSPFTVAIKGSSRPLVDNAELVKSIVGRAQAWDALVVGVLKSRSVRDEAGRSYDLLSIAFILHNGATITVTDKMRRYFFHMASLYEKGEIKQPWRPLSARTKVIVIRPRPFLEVATDQRMVDKYTENWAKAVQRALAGGM